MRSIPYENAQAKRWRRNVGSLPAISTSKKPSLPAPLLSEFIRTATASTSLQRWSVENDRVRIYFVLFYLFIYNIKRDRLNVSEYFRMTMLPSVNFLELVPLECVLGSSPTCTELNSRFC
jgi:hypothetical protein